MIHFASTPLKTDLLFSSLSDKGQSRMYSILLCSIVLLISFIIFQRFNHRFSSLYTHIRSTLRVDCFPKRMTQIQRIGTGVLLILLLDGSIKPAHAYIGAGLSVGTLIVVFALILSVFLAIISLFWYPLKRTLFGRKEEDDLDNQEHHSE